MPAGPLGQCHPIPDDPQLKAEMLKHARNYIRIHRMYNLPYQSEPGSDMAKVAYTRLLPYVSPCAFRRAFSSQQRGHLWRP